MNFVAQLKASVDIVKVIGEYVRLRKTGAERFIGLCPFHHEKTPSFSVHQGHQFYKCFGCGAGGDVLKFVMEIDGLSFPEALKLLAERNGIAMPKRAEYSDPQTKLRSAVYQMHDLAQQLFRSQLNGPSGSEARAYLARRGVSPEMIEQFGLGYAERSGNSLTRALEKQGFSAEQLQESGLVNQRNDGSGFFDRFRNRLMFPIHNESGQTIAFGGRALSDEDEPKYLNSPKTPIYEKRYVLYNLHRAKNEIRKADCAVLVEGYMDVIGVFQSGIRQVVASCGTALSAEQVRALRRHSARIVVNFDPDTAGASAAERSIQVLLEAGMQVRVLELEEGLDPDEFCQQRGGEAYRGKLGVAKGYFFWLADRARSKFDMREAQGRVAAFQFLLPSIHRLGDKIERVAVANDVAGYLGVQSGMVLEHFRKAAAERRTGTVGLSTEPVRPTEKILLSLLIRDAEARRQLVPVLRTISALDQFTTRPIFQALFALAESGEPFGFSDLEARLEENDKSLLAHAILADETESEAVSLEQGLACLRALEDQDRKAQIAALKSRVKEAERAGNFAEALRLSGELNEMQGGPGGV